MGQKKRTTGKQKLHGWVFCRSWGKKNCTGWGKENPSPKTSFLMELFLIDFFAEAEQFRTSLMFKPKGFSPALPFEQDWLSFYVWKGVASFFWESEGIVKVKSGTRCPEVPTKTLLTLVHFKRSEIWPPTSYFAWTLSKGCRKKAPTLSRATIPSGRETYLLSALLWSLTFLARFI